MTSRILVIGGQGMLGRPVVRRLLQDGFAVRVMARKPEKARPLLPNSAELVKGDLKDVGSMDKALEGCGAVYLSVDAATGSGFNPETDGLRNLVSACKNHSGVRLLLLSAFGSSDPAAEKHLWWHVRAKHEAQLIAKNSGLAWTIFEPVWYMEALPLFARGKTFLLLKMVDPQSHWIAGDDYGRMISAALTKGVGQGEIVPVQGREKISLREAARRFIQAYDPSIRTVEMPFWILGLGGIFVPKVRELKSVLEFYGRASEPVPDPRVWERFAAPSLTIEDYAAYIRRTLDFPRK